MILIGVEGRWGFSVAKYGNRAVEPQCVWGKMQGENVGKQSLLSLYVQRDKVMYEAES